MRIQIPTFNEKKELFDYLVSNKSKLITQKKLLPITSDPISFGSSIVSKEQPAIQTKANTEIIEPSLNELRVKTVANAANWIDMHKDMLLPGASAKSLKERQGLIPHLHDHEHKVSAEVGDVQDIYLSQVSLRELGLDKSGSTEAIIFVTDIKKSYNEKIFEKYKGGRIKQHSIGLQYVKLELAVNDSDWEKEKDFWDKYYPQVINKWEADTDGYFWVVSEFKLIENSAVLFGSNVLTPTLDNNMEKNIEPVATTQKVEPSKDTRTLDALNKLLTKIKTNNA